MLSGCAAPILGAALAAQGTTAAVALSLGPLDDLRDRTAEDQCRVLADKGISVTESLESRTPAHEGQALTFEPAWWRPEFASEGYPQVERARTPREGMLAISDRSLTFVPPAGASVSVRIPYELVRKVEVRANAGGTPAALIVGSCHGRFDIVTFGRGGKPDPAMTTDAAAALDSRLTLLRTRAGN
jgi:hypothetical protein